MADDLAVLLGKRFIQRRDVKAIQHANGAWTPDVQHQHPSNVDCPGDCPYVKWSMADIEAHIAGTKTFGHYLLGKDDTTKLFAFDLDLNKEGTYISFKEDELLDGGVPCNPREVYQDDKHPGYEYYMIQLRCMAEGLAMRTVRIFEGDVKVAVAFTGGKGLHVYGFLPEPLPAKDARQMATDVLMSFGCFEAIKGNNFYGHKFGSYRDLTIEVFPKQDSLGDGKSFGNLMALPLGVHRVSRKRKFFLDMRVGYNRLLEMDPETALDGEMPPWGGTYEDVL